MNLKEYIQYDGIALSELVKQREVSASELIELSFAQLEKVKELNITTSTRKEKALLDAEQMNLEGRFSGVPVLFKNASQAVKDEPLTGGARLLKDMVASGDSNFVKKFREAGFLITGHTNAPEFSLKNITEPILHGATHNPWNAKYSPGGSSGGAASAVASGVVPIAGASDGGGSIRIPASFTGLFGLKPTRGRTPVGPGSGRAWHGAAIDFVLTRSVRDSALMLDATQVVQEEAAFQTPLYPGSYLAASENGLNKKLRIAFSTRSPVGTPVSQDARDAVLKTVNHLVALGHEVTEAEPDIDGERVMRNYYLMSSGEMAKAIRNMEKRLKREVKSDEIEVGSWLLKEAGNFVSAVDFSESITSWDQSAFTMMEFHQTYDLYLTPATATVAPEVGELTFSEEKQNNLREAVAKAQTSAEKQEVIWDMYVPSLTRTPFTQLANLTGQPAASLPVYVNSEGLPLGIQLMASKGREELILQMAGEIERSDLWVGMQGNPYYE